MDALFAAISKSKSTSYRVIIKGDVRGSVEALKDSLELIESDKVLLEIIHSDVGQITKNDVKMANTSNADILGFNVKLENGVMGEAKHLGCSMFFKTALFIRSLTWLRKTCLNCLNLNWSKTRQVVLRVRQVFKVSKGRSGCRLYGHGGHNYP